MTEEIAEECAEVRAAFAALASLDAEQRRRVLCWFCSCGRYVGPGEACDCLDGSAS